MISLSIHKFSLFVCLYPINVKTAEPIGPKFCVGPRVYLIFYEEKMLTEPQFKIEIEDRRPVKVP